MKPNQSQTIVAAHSKSRHWLSLVMVVGFLLIGFIASNNASRLTAAILQQPGLVIAPSDDFYIQNYSGYSGDTGTIELRVASTIANVNRLDVFINYDPNLLTITGVRKEMRSKRLPWVNKERVESINLPLAMRRSRSRQPR
ncbi:hypothetical protein IPJ72_05915 [Candidatus Peregrinibacteria bacterium]|nr:MAG: hypothetical protein IPJ72_05915 [Candidatus Peregrinibacteria bacterium]